MIQQLRSFFESLRPTAPAESADRQLRLAAAVLLVEVMRADTHFERAERDSVLAALDEQFGLAADERDELLALAEGQANQATDWFAFTSLLNEHLDMTGKLRIVEHMWRVAYADGRLCAHEQHVMWRIADLLHVPQGAYIHAKMRARDAAGAS